MLTYSSIVQIKKASNYISNLPLLSIWFSTTSMIFTTLWKKNIWNATFSASKIKTWIFSNIFKAYGNLDKISKHSGYKSWTVKLFPSYQVSVICIWMIIPSKFDRRNKWKSRPANFHRTRCHYFKLKIPAKMTFLKLFEV